MLWSYAFENVLSEHPQILCLDPNYPEIHVTVVMAVDEDRELHCDCKAKKRIIEAERALTLNSDRSSARQNRWETFRGI